MKNLKRILSFLLVTAMLFTCVTVFAVENAEETAKTYSFDLSIENSVKQRYYIRDMTKFQELYEKEERFDKIYSF